MTQRMLGSLLLALWSSLVPATEGIVRMALVGDVMLAESEETGRLLAEGGDPFAPVRALLAGADVRVANFESSAGTQGSADPDKPYSFRTAQSVLPQFAAVFDVASVANNHAGDFGRADFVETLDALARVGVRPFGGGATPEAAHRAVLIERQGVKIALLGYLDFFPRWFAVAPGLPGVAWLDPDQAALDIARARTAGADVVLVIPHWGQEYEPTANPRQRRLARQLIDAGADGVIGGHPHVVQDEEVYRGKPIVYSLGNFVFDGFEELRMRTGWLLFADIDRQGIVALRTQVTRIDARGTPWPDATQRGPCWRRGQPAMHPCP